MVIFAVAQRLFLFLLRHHFRVVSFLSCSVTSMKVPSDVDIPRNCLCSPRAHPLTVSYKVTNRPVCLGLRRPQTEGLGHRIFSAKMETVTGKSGCTGHPSSRGCSRFSGLTPLENMSCELPSLHPTDWLICLHVRMYLGGKVPALSFTGQGALSKVLKASASPFPPL